MNPLEAPVPYAIFGDFNFRLDAHHLLQVKLVVANVCFSSCRLISRLQHIAEKRNGSIDKVKQTNSEEIARVIMKNDDTKMKLIIEKKEFNFHDDHDLLFGTDHQQVKAETRGRSLSIALF